MDPILSKFRDKFIEEAISLLDRLEKDLLELEVNPENKELIESAFRAMHTIKGVSGMYGFDFICEFTHQMESLYQAIRDFKLKFNKDIFDITFSSIDHIRKLLTDEKLNEHQNRSNHEKLLSDISKILGEKTTKIDTKEIISHSPISDIHNITENTWHIIIRTNEMIYFRGINIMSIFDELSTLGEFQVARIDNLSDSENDFWSIFLISKASEDEIREVFIFMEDDCIIQNLSVGNLFNANENDLNTLGIESEKTILRFIEETGDEKQEPIQQITEIKKPVTSEGKHDFQNFARISVDSRKLDNLMYLVSEFITVNSQVQMNTHDERFDSLRTQIEKIDNLSKLFRNNALDIRLIPLNDTILRFQRLIRDLSKQLNKKVELQTHGTDTELDKNTIDKLTEPLMHIIRNCIDHGIELPEARKNKGKPETGTIKISAIQSGNYVLIHIEDDGNGIDVEKVRLKAVDKGILKPTDTHSPKEILDLIFLPGFSTAQSLTEVSGRGVGMDVVKQRIKDLRGEVIVDSISGKGTTFTLKLQQSLAIIDTLLFVVQDTYLIVPISEIEICQQIDFKELNDHRYTGTIPYNDTLIHFIDLRESFNLEGEYDKKVKLIIINQNNKYIALLADTIVGEHQAVLKPLGKSFNQKYVTSASQLGDGNIAFMLDINMLFTETKITKPIISDSYK
jgi:two-component system chemotaxis sensor kinase CheA